MLMIEEIQNADKIEDQKSIWKQYDLKIKYLYTLKKLLKSFKKKKTQKYYFFMNLRVDSWQNK
jgi:hypothetical protein